MEKKKFRAEALKKLKRASLKQAYPKDKKIVKRLYDEIVMTNAQSIMLYLPLKMEVDMYPLIMRLRKEKRQVYVPFMEGASFRLVKYRLPLRKKQFGIKEPKDSKQYRRKQIDIAVVPIVGLDKTQRRVGFGKGMYDRFFEKNSKNIKQIVFVAREFCYSNKVVTDHYDVVADKVFTPQT